MVSAIDVGAHLPLPKARPGESVDILSFVVTKAGWESLNDRIGTSSSNPIRMLTRLIYQSVIEPIKQAGASWHALPRNHAKVIIYRQQKVAILGSFNVTGPSLGDNIECLCRVDGIDYHGLTDKFDNYWNEAEVRGAAQTDDDRLAVIEAEDSVVDLVDRFIPDSNELRYEPPRLPPWNFQTQIIQQVMIWLQTTRGTEPGRIVKLPTGAGKTLVAAEVICQLLEQRPKARVLWVCHRVELLRQSWLYVRRQVGRLIAPQAWFVPQHVEKETTIRDPVEFSNSVDRQLVF